MIKYWQYKVKKMKNEESTRCSPENKIWIDVKLLCIYYNTFCRFLVWYYKLTIHRLPENHLNEIF